MIGETIEAAAQHCRIHTGDRHVVTWKRPDAGGTDIITPIIQSIRESDLIVADISVLNFNVTYELAFAIGLGKRVLPIRLRSILQDNGEIQKVGLFDTFIYQDYTNNFELVAILQEPIDTRSRFATNFPVDPQPIYVLLPTAAGDDANHLLARVAKSGLRVRKFDPAEEARLALRPSIRSVASSHVIIIPLLGSEVVDSQTHNIRAAFVAGLAHGMEKVSLLLQRGHWTTPLDIRDQIVAYDKLQQMDAPIQDLVEQTMSLFYAARPSSVTASNWLADFNFGDPTAENEEVQLGEYFLERDEFRQALDGRARIVVGRKGSGKTAIYIEMRDRLRAARSNIVVDISPQAYQLRKFKDLILRALSEGSKEHLLAAFWEYVILLEICGRILKADEDLHKRNHKLYAPYQRLLQVYESESATKGANSSERLMRLIENIAERFGARHSGKAAVSLGESQLTNIMYEGDLLSLRREVEAYAREKSAVYILVDNLDKGWNASGLENADVAIIRTLLDASRKLERSLVPSRDVWK